MASRDEGWLSTLKRVAPDSYRGYAGALVAGLDAPEVVVDAFHVVRLGNQDARRGPPTGAAGDARAQGPHRRPAAAASARLLLTGHERLSQRGRTRLDAGLAARDPDDEVCKAHLVKQALRAVYAAGDQAAARGPLEESLRRRRRR